jgi:hypothetical protein
VSGSKFAMESQINSNTKNKTLSEGQSEQVSQGDCSSPNSGSYGLMSTPDTSIGSEKKKS